ncbi:hypothetical protein [Frankia sp. CcWB3]
MMLSIAYLLLHYVPIAIRHCRSSRWGRCFSRRPLIATNFAERSSTTDITVPRRSHGNPKHRSSDQLI